MTLIVYRRGKLHHLRFIFSVEPYVKTRYDHCETHLEKWLSYMLMNNIKCILLYYTYLKLCMNIDRTSLFVLW